MESREINEEAKTVEKKILPGKVTIDIGEELIDMLNWSQEELEERAKEQTT